MPRMPPLGDEKARANTYISNDSDWIRFDTTISTADDQIAMAPGYLQKEWHAHGRHYFHYTMDTPMLDFFSWVSGRYAVKKDRWHDIAIEVYYNPEHAWNVDDMIRGVKDSLAYYEAHYTPYQFRQLRILEFPNYDGSFAQSFANTIPFSEVGGLHRRPARPVEDRLSVLHHRARSGAPVVGAPGDRRQHAGLHPAQRIAGAVFVADGDEAALRQASRCAAS